MPFHSRLIWTDLKGLFYCESDFMSFGFVSECLADLIQRYQHNINKKTRSLICNYRNIIRSSQHYNDVIMSTMASKITSISMVCSTVCSDADQRKHQRSASLAFVRGIHRWPVNSLHKGPVTRKMFPFDDVIMVTSPSYGHKNFMSQLITIEISM